MLLALSFFRFIATPPHSLPPIQRLLIESNTVINAFQMRYKIQPTYSQHVRNPLCVVFIARCLAIRNMNTMGSLSTKPGRNAFEISLYAEVNVYCSIFH